MALKNVRSNIPKRIIVSDNHLLKTNWSALTENYSTQIACISSTYRMLLLRQRNLRKSSEDTQLRVICNKLKFEEIQIKIFPVLPFIKSDRNCTEINNWWVCSHSFSAKMECSIVKMSNATIYGRSKNFLMLYWAWDFFSDVFVWKKATGREQAALVIKETRVLQPPWVLNCLQNLNRGLKLLFPKRFDSYRG